MQSEVKVTRKEIIDHYLDAIIDYYRERCYGIRITDTATSTRVEMCMHRSTKENMMSAFAMFDDGFFKWAYRIEDWQVEYFTSS